MAIFFYSCRKIEMGLRIDASKSDLARARKLQEELDEVCVGTHCLDRQ